MLNRTLDMLVSDEEPTRCHAHWSPPPTRFGRGHGWMFTEHILQADQACDMDFLRTHLGESAGEPDVF